MKIKTHLLIFLLILAVGVGLYYQILNNFFLSDDFQLLYKNINYGANIHESFFRPISDLSISFDYLTWKLNPLGFYLQNIFLFSITGYFIFLITKLLFELFLPEIGHLFYSGLASLFFITYPFHHESIAWISGRGSLLSGALLTASLYFYLKYVQINKSENIILSIALFFISLFVYESGFTFPLIILIFNVLLHKNQRTIIRKTNLAFGYFIMLFIAYLIIRYINIGALFGNYFYESINGAKVIKLCGNLARLVARSFIPPLQNTLEFMVGVAILCFIFILGLVRLRFNKKYIVLFFLLVFFIVSLIPVISFGIDTHDSESERFLYFPSVFLSILIAVAISLVGFSDKIKYIFTLIIVSSNCIFLLNYMEQWDVASDLTKYVIQYVSESKNSKSIYIENLPDQYKGAYIFRNGLNEAVDIFVPDNCIQNIEIISRSQIITDDTKREVLIY